MNIVILVGRLTKDPELSYTPNTQTAVCHFTLAVDRPRRSGESTGADFFRITTFGKQAENSDRYLAKGRQAAVIGRAETGNYKNRDGVTVNTLDIIASNVEFLGTVQNTGNNNVQPDNNRKERNPRPQKEEQTSWDDLPDSFQAAEDDIPF